MKKIFFVLFCGLVCFVNSLSAQETNDYENKYFKRHGKKTIFRDVISLKARPLEFNKKNFHMKFSDHSQKKHIYVKFRQTPTKLMCLQLKKQGISIKDHLADNAYIIEVTDDSLKFLKQKWFVEGFADIDPVDKMTPKIYKKEIPSYALDGNYVKLIVAFYKDVSFSDASRQIKDVGGELISTKFSRTHKLRVKIHIDNVDRIAEIETVKYVHEISPPKTTSNIDAGKLSNVFWDNDGNTISGLFDQDFRENPVIPYGLRGLEINVGVKDEGAIYDHSDFGDRLDVIDDDSIAEHATHVAGTIGSILSLNDNDGNTGGMAELVNLYSFSFNLDGTNPATTETDFIVDYVEAIENYSTAIFNNSWGTARIGWANYPEGYYYPWKYYGDLYGDYTSDTQDYDDFIYDYYDNDAVQFKSAGNNRYKLNNKYKPHPSFYDPNIYHDGVYYEADNDYYYCMEPYSCAKNIVTVGSVGIEDNDSHISVFSSFGPTDDGRVKPDVVADGFELTSTVFLEDLGQYIDAYSDNDSCGHTSESEHAITCKKYWKGTSMSCPVVTGICALMHEAYYEVNEEYPTADVVKALLCNYANDLGKAGPDFSYGFGLVDGKACIDAIFNYDASEGGHIQKGTITETGDYLTYQIELLDNLNADATPKVTLVWIDPSGNPMLDNDSAQLVNDLDLTVSDNEGNIYYPFYFKEYSDDFLSSVPPVNPTEPAKLGPNRYDTVEQVMLIDLDNDGIIPAGMYTITISGFKISSLTQPFAVVSTIGFREFHFNTLKVRGAEGVWVSNQFAVLDKNPDVLLMVSDSVVVGIDPDGFEYSFSTDGGANWTTGGDVTGVYEDENCTEPDNSATPVAYVKVENLPFNNVSTVDNRIKFVYNDGEFESPQYLVRNNNIYYVNGTMEYDYDNDGIDDFDGKGTKLYPWKSIAYAITNCVATGTVPAYIRVQQGTYNEDISLNSYIYLYGGYDSDWCRDVEDNATTIHGSGTTHVVITDSNVVIDGFIIENGNDDHGGGIYSPGYENVVIENCTIQDCTALIGGGLFVLGGSLLVSDSVIKNNSAIDGLYGGGAVYIQGATGHILRSRIVDNIGQGYFSSGGAFYVKNSSFIIEQCNVESNTNISTGGGKESLGGGIYLDNSSGSVIKNCIFKSNVVSGFGSILGGAIFVEDTSNNVEILGSLFYMNQAGIGSAIYCYGISITNCTFYGNIATSASNNCAINTFGWEICRISNCIFRNNTSYDYRGNASYVTYSCMDNDSYNSEGMIHDDPHFRDPANGDFRLKIESPCIDAGYDSAVGLDILSTDINGNTRKFEFDNEGDNSVDMGAYEYIWLINGFERDNNGDFTIEWESLDNDTYYIAYTDRTLEGSPSPLLHFKMNDSDNDSIVIESANGIHGIFYDNEGYINTEDYSVAGKIDDSLEFDGNRYINCGNAGNISSDLSICAWVYLIDTLDHRTIVNKSWNNAYRFRVHDDGTLWFLINDGSGSEIEYSENAISTGQWTHVAVTVDFSTQEVKFYIDGELDTTESTAKTGINSTTDDLLIGAYTTVPDQAWKGCLDDIRIYNCTLSDEDIQNIYDQGSGTEDENPLMWTRLQQGITGQTGTTAWTDNGTEISPPYDNDGLIHRFYKVVFDN